MNDMRLRKISCLLSLAEMNLRRNQRQAATPLLELGIKMAKAYLVDPCAIARKPAGIRFASPWRRLIAEAAVSKPWSNRSAL